MTTVWLIQDYDDILGIFSTRELADAWLEANVRKEHPDVEPSWRDGKLGAVMNFFWGRDWRSFGMTPREFDLDPAPPQ